MYNIDVRPLFFIGIIIVLVIWGCWELIDFLWIDEVIRTNKPIIPEIKLTIKNNIVDTIYIYREP